MDLVYIFGYSYKDEIKHITVKLKHSSLPFAQNLKLMIIIFILYRAQKSFGRTDFKESTIFNGISVDDAYTRKNQMEIFANQPESWLNRHINTTQFLARGHLSPLVDFVYGSQQMATFYYANAAPQWQLFNSGNWLELESSIRMLSVTNNLELNIYTGTHGEYKVNGENVFLTKDTSDVPVIPVSQIFWKVVFDQENSMAVVFFGLNDPDANAVSNPVKNLCKDVCNLVKWVKFKLKPELGLMYCCTVEEFSKVVKILPPYYKRYV